MKIILLVYFPLFSILAQPVCFQYNKRLLGIIAVKPDSNKPLINYSIPDSTKIFVDQLFNPSRRDSVYFKEKDIVDLLFGNTISINKKKEDDKKGTKNPKTKTAQIKDHHKNKIYFSFFPSTNVRTGAALVTATNAAFYLGNYRRTKLSSVTFVPVFNLNGQFNFPMRTNLWTDRNKFNLVGDYRFMIFPFYTFGLGSNTDPEDRLKVFFHYFRFHQDVLKQIKKELFIGGGYALDYYFNITDNQSPEAINKFRTYGIGTQSNSIVSGITSTIVYDDRPNSINPDAGWYGTAILRTNLGLLGSNHYSQSLYLDGRKYIRLSSTYKDILAFWGIAWFTLWGESPYLALPSIGWDTYSGSGRGYDQGRFRGRNMLYFESEYRFNLMANGLLGAVFFTNLSSYSEPVTNAFDNLLPAIGTGIRIKLNKLSGTNLAGDVGIGANGSWGVYFTIGEVF